jgi:chemotaxis protein CheZ
MSNTLRRFRIEGVASAPVMGMNAYATSTVSVSMPDPDIRDTSSPVLEEIRALRAMMTPMRGVMETLSDSYRAELKTASAMREDMSEIDSAIQRTKQELAAIKVGRPIGGVDIAALELTTVVNQTEAATNDILAATEAIETMAGAIQSETTLEAAKELATKIAERATIIYMACNFQDLSGQRVSRVVDTLSFIEGRVHKMIETWGGLQALNDLIENEIRMNEEERETQGADALLTGPVPVNSNDHVDQSAIDDLFN